MKKKQGFTFVEIIMVGVILGVLATLAIPRLFLYLERARTLEAVEVLSAILKSQHRYKLENGAWSENINILDITFSTPSGFYYPTTDVTNVTQSPAVLASTMRNVALDSYTLSIDENGDITCDPFVGGSDICVKVGYE